MRWQGPELTAIDEWREAHNVPTRPEANRQLVELGLEAKAKCCFDSGELEDDP
jgi:hypothetical protein